MKTFFCSIFTLLTIFASATEAKKLTLTDISSPKLKPTGITALRSMADGEHFTAISADGYSIVRYRYADGVAVDTIFNATKVKPTFKVTGYTLSSDEKLILLPSQIDRIYRHSSAAYNWLYDRTTSNMTPLSAGGKQQAVTFAPDGNMVAFVRERNIFIVDLVSKKEDRITIDGHQGTIINGVCDWVYEEEFGFERAFEWSPSSDAIAYYRFDETKVKNYPMPTFNGKLYPENLIFKYPKAGQVNSIVQIKVFQLATGAQTSINVGFNSDQYIPRIEWTGRGDELAVHRVNRRQNHYDLLLCNSTNGLSHAIYSESSPRYVERIDKSKVHFLPQSGRMVIQSELNESMQLYLYEMSGKFIRRLTTNIGEVTAINSIDERSGKIYFTATDGPLYRALYCASIGTSGNVRKLSSCDSAGFYSADFSNGGKYYIQNFSNTTTPNIYTVHKSNGKLLRTLENNGALKATLSEFEMPIKEFFTFVTEDGVVLNGYMLKPVDFDAGKRYPVLMTQYSGPGSQEVAHRWGIGWEAALVGEGYLVACVDGRGTGFRGFEFKSCTYGRLGELETEDQISAARYLGSLPYIDKARIGIYGWSYGGFMALNCILKGADVFAVAIAIAPVTSWRFYDTIYTEIYNGLPSENAAGYDDNSPINYADKLKGKLLIAHGTADDNVHIQNSFEMISSLNRAGKDYRMILYPDRNHSMRSGSGNDRDRLMEQCLAFLKSNL